MVQFIFKCPATGLNVQHAVDDDQVPDNEFEAITCPACARLHFVNRKTGRLLGHEDQ
jgi:hypothetical protein